MTHPMIRGSEAAERPPSSRTARRPNRRRMALLLATFVFLIAVTARVFGLVNGPTETINGSLPEESTPPPPYPISGYFISASSNDSANHSKLADIKALGGDTVITFGTLLKPATQADVPMDCVTDGKVCTQALSESIRINRYFTYFDGSRWGAKAVKCPRDREVVNKGKSYTILVFPTQGEGCTSTNGSYDLVIVGGGSRHADDPARSLAAASTELNMKYYAGLPSPVKRSDLDYLPDLSYKGTLKLFTERFLDYQEATNDLPGLAGFYHHTEMPLTSSDTFTQILDLYKMQNDAIHRILPTRAAIVSPYLDTRRNALSISLDEAREGSHRIAATSGRLRLIIAIQDGMGTGKAGAFSDADADVTVDKYAASVVGDGSWRSRYVAPIRQYFLAAQSGISGTEAELWANLEGMAPATGSNACGNSLRGQTTKERIDRQLQQLFTVTKIVSFMWDSYYTCDGTGTPLKTQIEQGLKTPIITDAKFHPSSGKVEIIGFNLAGGSATVKWTTQEGRPMDVNAAPNSTNPSYGKQEGMNPRLESLSIEVGPTTLEADSNYVVNVTNGWGIEAPYFFAQRVWAKQSP